MTSWAKHPPIEHGIESAPESQPAIGAAHGGDLPAILALLGACGLPEDGVAAHVDTLLVARLGTAIVGSAGLEMYGDAALLRSVAVAELLRGTGLGQRLTRAALDLAAARGARAVYLLTETAGEFFPRFGFTPTTRDAVPAAVQQSVEFQSVCPRSALVMVRRA